MAATKVTTRVRLTDDDTATAERPAFQLIDLAEAARLLNVGTAQVFVLQQRPDFPRVRWIGNRGRRFVLAEIEAWALAQTERPPGKPGSRGR